MAAVAGACAAILLGVGVGAARRAPEPPVLSDLPPFALVDHERRPVTRETLAGRPFVADFIFTRCGGACPAMTSRMARLSKEVTPGTRFVSFTVDPANDTPEALGAYAAAHHAGPQWLFATGTQKDLFQLATGGFKLATEAMPPGSADGPFLHSQKFVLVDARAHVRGYYDSEDEEAVARLREDLRRIE
jgi:protein SCO1/2